MRSKTIHHLAKLGLLALTGLTACVPALEVREARRALPATFDDPADTTIAARSDWRQFFQDEGLALLIDSALLNNQEFNILMQEVAMARNEVKARKGEYLPYVDITAGGGVDKVGRYTRSGAVESILEIAPEREFPEPLGDLQLGLPWQSVSDGERLLHEPVRLLAVVQAPLSRIDEIVERNPILQQLFGNDWVALAAREQSGQPWQRWTRAGWRDWTDTADGHSNTIVPNSNIPTNNEEILR